MAGSLKFPRKSQGCCCFIVVMPARRHNISRFSPSHSRGSASSSSSSVWCVLTWHTSAGRRGELGCTDREINRAHWDLRWERPTRGGLPHPPLLWARDLCRDPDRQCFWSTESVNRMQSCFFLYFVFALILSKLYFVYKPLVPQAFIHSFIRIVQLSILFWIFCLFF